MDHEQEGWAYKFTKFLIFEVDGEAWMINRKQINVLSPFWVRIFLLLEQKDGNEGMLGRKKRYFSVDDSLTKGVFFRHF